MKRNILLSLKILLTALLLFIVLAIVNDFLNTHDSTSRAVWDYQCRTEQQFYWENITGLICISSLLAGLWLTRLSMWQRLLQALPMILYMLYLNLLSTGTC